jgi:hypothetical protein
LMDGVAPSKKSNLLRRRGGQIAYKPLFILALGKVYSCKVNLKISFQ